MDAASQARPGNRALVHHMAITEAARADGVTEEELNALGLLSRQFGIPNVVIGARSAVTAPKNPVVVDMLGMYTPGSGFELYRGDSAKLLKGGQNMYTNFNIHNQATGQPEKDRSMIGLWFHSNSDHRSTSFFEWPAP